MNDLRPALRSFLLADANIAALVDSGSSATMRYRIFPGHLPQGEVRASLVYHRISGIGDHHNQGASGLARPRYQIDAWAGSADAVQELSAAIKQRLDGYRGLMGDVIVKGAFFDSERDDYDGTGKLYRVSQDYLIWFDER